MKIPYLLQRLRFRLAADGVVKSFKDMVFFNRELVIVEKNLETYQHQIKDDRIRYVMLDIHNSLDFEVRFNLPLFHHYACIGCKTLVAILDDVCVGFIRWTRDNNFWDLKKFNIQMNPNEAYLFDFFIFPEFRGDSYVNDIPTAGIHQLQSRGVNKIYGFYFLDNRQALWWNRAILRVKEVKRLKSHRFLTLDIVEGKVFI